MEIDAQHARQALKEALAEYPQFEAFGPRLEYQELFQGGAWVVRYERTPPRDTPGAWDFQNAVVKGYKRLAGVP